MTWIPRPAPKPERTPRRLVSMKGCGGGQRAKRTKGTLFPKLVQSGLRAWVRKQRCIATGVKTGEWVRAKSWMPPTLKALCPYKAQIVVAHVKSRGAGGTDLGNVVPLERVVHDLQGQWGWPKFEKKIGVMRAAEIAHELGKAFVARQAAIAKNLERGVSSQKPPHKGVSQ